MAELNARVQKIVSDLESVLTPMKRNELLSRLPVVKDLEMIQVDVEALSKEIQKETTPQVESDEEFGDKVLELVETIDRKASLYSVGKEFHKIQKAIEIEITSSWVSLKNMLYERFDRDDEDEPNTPVVPEKKPNPIVPKKKV